jgi:O-antigen biosynthesis protein
VSGGQDYSREGDPCPGRLPRSSRIADPGAGSSSSSRSSDLSARHLRICLVSFEFLGPFRNGGIGTAYTRLAELLNEAGHDVTLLYTRGRYTLTQPVEHWITHYADRGIRFVPLPESPVRPRVISHYLEIAHSVYLWLKSHDEFDIVHFPECLGEGYYALAAQRQGLILQNAITIVGLHGSSQWVRVASERLPCWEAELENDFIERRSAELADIVWSPGQYMLDWVRQQGWKPSNSTYVQPYVVPEPERVASGIGAAPPAQEIVFFGRQEVRKGLLLFLAAIDRLVPSWEGPQPPNLVVTFLGKPTEINGQDSELIIRDHSRHWPFPVRVLSDRNEQEALDYLQGPGRLAVMPSLIENYPNTVLECLAHRVPFLASRVGGIPEQIAVEDLDRVCFEPKPPILAQRLLEAVRQGHAPSRLAFDPGQNSRTWVHWHEQLHHQRQSHRPAAVGDLTRAGDPTVSVCVVHHGRSDRLREALASLLHQRRPPLEVIVVAPGSPAEGMGDAWDAIAPEFDFAGRGWRLIRPGECSLGSACNRAAAAARGDFVLFLDEEAIAKPEAVATFTAVARRTGADVLSGLIDVCQGRHTPGGHRDADLRRLFTGANHPLSLLHNTFGDFSTVFRRAAFLAVGGFSEELERGQEDWELFARLMVQGYQITVIPEALFWDRVRPGDAVRPVLAQGSYLRTLRPYLELVPPSYHTLLELMMGQALAKRIVAAPAPVADAPAPQPEPPPPLRYRLVDALNRRLKRIRLVHEIAKKSLQGMLWARRIVAGRIHTMQASGEVHRRSRAHRNLNIVRHAGAPMNGKIVSGRNDRVGRSARVQR